MQSLRLQRSHDGTVVSRLLFFPTEFGKPYGAELARWPRSDSYGGVRSVARIWSMVVLWHYLGYLLQASGLLRGGREWSAEVGSELPVLSSTRFCRGVASHGCHRFVRSLCC